MGWLIETAPTSLTLTEGVGGKLMAKGLFGICGVPTANGRIYPKKLIEREIKRLDERMRNRQVMGELDHPDSGKTSLMRVSHIITRLSLDGDNVMGEAEILPTPNGKILRALVEAGVRVGVSSRGFGSTKATQEGDEVGEDFALNTYDFVADPSVRTALPRIYQESVEAPVEQTPVDLFRAEWPEAYAELTEAAARDAVERAKEQTAAVIERAVEAERTRVQAEQREAFERQLATALVDLREDLTRELREEYEADPAVAGARAALAQIAEMVGPYRQEPDAAAVADALKAAELEVATAQGAAEQAEERAVQAERLLKLERGLAGNPLAEALRKVLAPAVLRGTDADFDANLGHLIEEAQGLVPQAEVTARVEERQALIEAQAQAEKQEQDRAQLVKQVEALKAKLERAVQIGKELDEAVKAHEATAEAAEAEAEGLRRQVTELELRAYKVEQTATLPNRGEALRLLEGARDQGTVDQVVAASRAQGAMVDGALERARQAVRGHAPGATAFRLEEAARPVVGGAADEAVERTGLAADDLMLLAGLR